MSYSKAMTSKRYNAGGKSYEVDEVLVEFSNEGSVEQVEIYNEVLQDWFIIDYKKLNSIDQAKLKVFVMNALDDIHEQMSVKEYENDDRASHE